MKEMKIILSCFIFTVLINTIQSTNEPEIKLIVSAALNGTASYVSLDYIPQNENFVYFSFDFAFHRKTNAKNKKIALFLLSTSLDFQDENSLEKTIVYGFSGKSWTDITSKDLEEMKWEKMNIVSKEKNYYDDFEYYLKSERNLIKYNSLILRIPTLGKNEGSITVENVFEFPSRDKNEL